MPQSPPRSSDPSRPDATSRPEALQVLLDASAMLLATSSQKALLGGILDLASKLFHADAYALWRIHDGGTVWRAVATRGLSDSYRTEIRDATFDLPAEVQTYEDTEQDPSLTPYQEVYKTEQIRGMLVAPLVLAGAICGTITFYWHAPQRFTQLDKDYAAALANLAAAALTISELHEQNDREKLRLSFLAEASAVLASSLDYETTLQLVAKLAVPHVADWCSVHVVENGAVNRLVVAHADPAMLRMAKDYSERYPEEIRDDRGLGAVLRTGITEVYPRITDEMIVQAARDEEHLTVLRELGMTSSILVALTSRGKVLGAIRLLAAGGTRHFTPADVQLAEDLALRAGAAIENAQLHRAVLEQENQLRLSHAAARMGHWTWEPRRRKVFWSDEYRAMHGIPHDLQADFDLSLSVVHPEDRERVLASTEEQLTSQSDQLTLEYRAVTPDGRPLYIQSRGRILRDSKGEAEVVHGISIDVTESRQAEQALRRTEKLAAAGRLAATVAHEVNNPLEALTNLIYLAQTTEGIPAQAATYLATAESELGRMAHIVRQTLGFYRESLHPQLTDIGTIVSEVIELYRQRATARSIELLCQCPTGLTALVNGGEIKQVIANLVSNAIDASQSGGSILTDVQPCGADVEIRVIDTGSGIAPEALSHLFEPFFTTKADIGTGLGLWVSKGIIEKHNGTIAVISRTAEPSGTTMTLRLPLA